MEKVHLLDFAEEYIINHYQFNNSKDIDYLVKKIREWFEFYHRGEFYKPIDVIQGTIDEMVDIYEGLGEKGIELYFGRSY